MAESLNEQREFGPFSLDLVYERGLSQLLMFPQNLRQVITNGETCMRRMDG